MQAYFWIKTAHLVFVFAWVAAAFYLPRLLVNLAEAGDEPAVRARLVLMGRRLMRFGRGRGGAVRLVVRLRGRSPPRRQAGSRRRPVPSAC